MFPIEEIADRRHPQGNLIGRLISRPDGHRSLTVAALIGNMRLPCNLSQLRSDRIARLHAGGMIRVGHAVIRLLPSHLDNHAQGSANE